MKNSPQHFNSGIEEPITPIDGRYRDKVQELASFYSEYALTKYRIFVELQFLIKLSEEKVIPKLTKENIQSLHRLHAVFDANEFKKVKNIENKINHDVKSVEYYLREKFQLLKLKKYIQYIHIGLTSEDTNNLAYSLILKDSTKQIFIPLLEEIMLELKKFAQETKHLPILGRTHGQPAVSTTFGKEISNYYYRLNKQINKVKKFSFEGKCNGAVGNYNALQFVFPNTNWISFSKKLVQSMGLQWNPATTQILPYDNWVEFFQTLAIINGILVDFATNIWTYIMLEVLVQKKKSDEVGSSTMPQKINPIHFENAEGVLQLANAHYEFYSRKLLSSRLQRDLSDSTVRRTFGSTFAYTILGWKSILSGIKKIMVNKKKITEELNQHWEVLSEAIQVYLRSEGNDQGYEQLKTLTRGKTITKEMYFELLKKLGLDSNKKFTDLSPKNYLGLVYKLIDLIL